MKFKIEGQEYTLDFTQTYYGSGRKARHFTEAILTATRGEGSVSCYGCAIMNPKDDFNPWIGKKVALSRALAALPRSFRERIWHEYLRESEHQRNVKEQYALAKRLHSLQEKVRESTVQEAHAIITHGQSATPPTTHEHTCTTPEHGVHLWSHSVEWCAAFKHVYCPDHEPVGALLRGEVTQ